MTDSGPARPRRALAPLPDDDGVDAPPTLGRRAARALPAEPDAWPAEADTQLLRRVILPDSPTSPASPVSPPVSERVWAPTPVPPPRPVLPGSGIPAGSAGRRFSSDTPSEHPYVPRRSATSVASPPEEFFVPVRSEPPAQPPIGPSPVVSPSPVVDPDPVAVPDPVVAEPARRDRSARPRRSGRRALIALGSVAAITGLVVAAATLLKPPDPVVTVPPPTSASPSLDPLVGGTDLAILGTTSWTDVAGAPGGGDGSPVCLPAGPESMPVADRTYRKVLTSAEADVDYVSHVVDTYADRTAAAAAYQQRMLQAGSCADTDALIISTDLITGLADSAFVTQIQVQGSTVENHTLLVSVTGRTLSMIDISAPAPVQPAEIAAVATKPLARLCSAGQGTCPTNPEPVPSIPAAGQNPGWLIEADLPRITPGAGRWAASRPDAKLSIVGSQCESATLKKVEGLTASAQRTLLLADDPAAPTVFGVDQVVYTFPDAKAAKSFADKITGNIAECGDREPNAEVAEGPTAKGEGASAVEFSGKSYLVTRQTANGAAVTYRIGVVRVAERVSYLLANPGADFDFTDVQWKAILERTGERVSQMP